MSFESLPATIRNELDAVCDAFEEVWKAGQRPRIEEYVSARTEPERTVLFQMLLEVEVELRRKAGDSPDRHEYLERFEAYTEVIRTVLGDPRPDDEIGAGPLPTTKPRVDFTPPIYLGSTVLVPADPLHRPADPASRPIPKQIGRYQVIRELGRGNFVVYQARDDRVGRDVAIKVARPEDPSGRLRLMSLAEEAEKIKALQHPRVVKLYEYVPPGEPGIGADGYIVLEYVEGQTLEKRLQAGPMPVLRLTRIIALVAEAAHHAHTQSPSIVHRDLKPSNILLDLEDQPHVCDFGLAIDEDVQRLRRGEIAGTPMYMAPEQVRGEFQRLDGRTDIWALGVILYRGLTGKLPFPGRDQVEIFEEILHRDPRPLRMYDPGIEPELERICLRCLSRPMSERYLTAADLAADLKRMIDELPPPPIPAPDAIVPKGLRPFDVEDARFFLALLPGPRRGDGMPESVRFWKDRVEGHEGEKVFSIGMLYGPSGGGKSSFVRAGLLPNLDRGRVRPVYLEASPVGTESRLLAELRREAPTLPPDANLADSVAILRDDTERRSAGKLFIVLDQFEQWLQAHPDEPDAELVQALRQCDGRRVQALVLVRDDFWMAVTRFLRAVDVPLVQGGNAAAVEFFDARHARKVLEGFGQALGQIPQGEAPGTGEAALFLDEAARGLTGPDDRVIPARLSLFTEVVRHRPWTPATLQALGGVDGIGVKFLDDCFESAPYKGYRSAAKAVLKKLLPPPTTVIRGTPRSAAELRGASGYTDQPGEFAELIRVLDRELQLVAATELDSSTPGPDRAVPPGETCYQLAHDYLVRPIRQWLEREQGSTRKGRAQLRLALITASWRERPGPRRLPSLLEWTGILLHIAPSEWSADERSLMHATNRHYLTRGVAAAALLIGLAVGGKAISDRGAAASLLGQAITAEYRNLPEMIRGIQPYRSLLIRDLEAYERNGRPHEREVAGVLLYHFAPTPERGRYLREHLLAASGPDELELLRDALAVEPRHAGAEALWQIVGAEGAEPGERIRAAAALARLEPDHPGWANAGVPVARAMLGEDRRTIPRWIELLGPVARAIVPVLAKGCRDPAADSAARAQVAEALAETLTRGQDVESLSRALVDAQPDAARILRHALAMLAHRQVAVGYLHGVLDERPADGDAEDRKDAVASRRAEAAITLAVLGEPELLWPLLAHRPDPQLRARLIHTLVDSGLAPQVLLDRLNRPGLEAAQRQALLLALAEAHPTGLILPVRSGFVESAGTLFQHDPDPGVHSAADLLLRRWEHEDVLQRTFDPPPAGRALAGADGRRWENGPNGHTLAILPSPLTYWMGSPEGKDEGTGTEHRHYRRIDRSIAVATMEVSADQFRVYVRAKNKPEYNPQGRAAREPGVVATEISWYDAAGYCNWLSEKANLPQEQWCYPREVKPGEKPIADVLKKCGYRLPTEAEWEYFCRARTDTSRFFGETDTFLSRYAWTWLNSMDRTHPPGRLLPNEFGLFDTLGNVQEWCQEGPKDPNIMLQDPYPLGTPDKPAPDIIPYIPILNDDVWHYIRGGSYEGSPFKARSAFRDEGHPNAPLHRWGFRVVRTLPGDLH